jgi:hypothetical protein
MKKSAYFDSKPRKGWPEPDELKPYFLAPPGNRWFNTGGNDAADLRAEGIDGTGDLEEEKGRVDLSLMMWGNPDLGVLLIYRKYGGGLREAFTSYSDLNRLDEFVRTLHGDKMPIGLYIPFEDAWKAVKEFIETDGQLPKSIDWVANKDLPPNTFPPP